MNRIRKEIGKPIYLGLMAPLTGIVALYGREISHAGLVAVEEINEKGGLLGRPLELIIEDDGSSTETAVAAARRLVQKGCSALIGNLLSNVRIAVASHVAEPERVPMLNFSFYEGSIFNPYYFNFSALPNQQIDKMIPYMAARFGSKMFFAGSNYEWPRGSIHAAKAVLQRFGGEMVGEAYLPQDNREFGGLIEKVSHSGADVFVPYFAGQDQVNVLNCFAAEGLKSRMAVVMGHFDEVLARQLAPSVREGLFSSNSYFMSLDTEANRAFLKRLESMPDVTGIYPEGNGVATNFGEGTYICVKAFAEAVNEAGGTELAPLLSALKQVGVKGPQGWVAMDAKSQHASVNAYLARCRRNGSFSIEQSFGRIKAVIPNRYRAESQATLSEPPNSTPDFDTLGIMYASLAGRVFHVSSHFSDMLNIPKSSLIGQNVGKIIHPEDKEKGLEMVRTLVEKNEKYFHVLAVGVGKELHLKASLMYALSGEPTAILLSGWIKKSMTLQADDRLSDAIMTIHLDATRTITYLNENVARFWGLARAEDAIGTSICGWFVDEHGLTGALDQAKPNGWTGHLQAKGAEMGIEELQVTIEPLYSESCTIVGKVLTCLRSRQSQEASLSGFDSQLLLAIGDIAILIVDENGVIQRANSCASTMFGYEVNELVGLSVQFLVPPRFRKGHAYMMREFIARDMTENPMNRNRELVGYCKKGSEFPIQTSLTIFKGPSGRNVVVSIKDISARKRTEESLIWQATHDALTQLPNRALLSDRLTNALDRAKRSEKHVGLLFIDLDGFKMVNDSYGHETGDFLLREVARRLLHTVRPGDTVARFGGDEFVIVCEQIAGKADLIGLAERIMENVRAPFDLEQHQVFITTSIGLAVAGSHHTAQDLLRNVDATMYSAKENGRDCWQLFNNHIHDKVFEEMRLANGLRQAIERGEMEVVFQPIVDAERETIVGAELLLRWSFEGKAISPGMFIPVAERTGSIVKLGHWVFEQACLAQKRLSKRFPEVTLYLSVNVSARQFQDKNLIEQFQETLANTQANAKNLLIEITESALMRDVQTNANLLKRFGDLGLKLAVDDFGTGYSSLSQLIRLPVNHLKIDRAFIMDIHEHAGRMIVAAIVSMALALGLKVIAEGVEEKKQWEILSEFKCHCIQGYFFHRPMSFDNLIEVLAEQGNGTKGVLS